ncbi:MAG: DUF3576 domain-containing protein [Rhodobacter sp.]|nr:DUF3576 domain-containing protein [Rhodobacter sp.]
MRLGKYLISGSIIAATLVLSGCGNSGGKGLGRGIFAPRDNAGRVSEGTLRQRQNTPVAINRSERAKRGSIWDLFSNSDDPNVTVEVNKYIWNAALDVLNFLPIQAADPFSGVIVTGYGTPPGGGRAYRATVYIKDPALDARSLNLALQGRNGQPASRETVQAVEDAILTRARQLRIADGRL